MKLGTHLPPAHNLAWRIASYLCALAIIVGAALAIHPYAQAQGTAPYTGPRPSGVLPYKSPAPQNNQPNDAQPTTPFSDDPVDSDYQNDITNAPDGLPDGSNLQPYAGPDDASTSQSSSTNWMAFTNMRHGELVEVPQDEVILKDFFAAGESIRISGTVNGDVYAAGGMITIDGVVHGDVLVAGGTIDISGTVDGNVRAVGGQLHVSGSVGRNATMIGGSAQTTTSAQLAGNAVIAAGSSVIEGTVGGNALVASEKLHIGGTVRGDVDSICSTVTISESARINGNLTHVEDDGIQIQEGQVAGTITEISITDKALSAQDSKDMKESFAGIAAMFALVSVVSTIIIGLLLVYVLPRFTQNVANTLTAKPLQSLGMGVLMGILMPVIGVMLLVTIVGIPLGLLTLMLFGLGLYVSQFFIMFLLGRFIIGKMGKQWHDGIVFIVGFALYTLLQWIPVIGAIGSFIAAIAGFGALLLAKKDLFKAMKAQGMI